ncbi:flavodoxin [Scardovia wiggsiae]|uniref:flavodoxin n=1 Tax=Scardovia wiggsiae TaxID=230143 RepID=UPI00362B6CE0
MKKLTALIMSLLMMFSLVACNSGETNTSVPSETESAEPESVQTSEPESTPSSEPENETAGGSGSNTLVVYFSMPETTNPDESSMTEEERNSTVIIDGEVLGNTQYVAYVIQENTGADLFRIEPEVPYPTDHDTLVDQAAEEQDNGARPAIKDTIENFDQYDTIFVGYPNWWSDMPMILYTFFDTYDFSGKTIIPFNTNGGSGFSNTISMIAELEPDASIYEDGFTVSRNNVQEAEPDILAWLNELGYSN